MKADESDWSGRSVIIAVAISSRLRPLKLAKPKSLVTAEKGASSVMGGVLPTPENIRNPLIKRCHPRTAVICFFFIKSHSKLIGTAF